MPKVFHPSLECVQHGGKPIVAAGGDSLLSYAKKSGCIGVQPSNFHLVGDDGAFVSEGVVKSALEAKGLRLDGISAHCLFWVHGAAHTGTPCIRKFIPEPMWQWDVQKIEDWAEAQCIALMDLSVALGNRVIPMFWGPYHGLEVASGYPWGMWDLPGVDLVKAGDERFVTKTARMREHARKLKISIAHEIHPGTSAMCADDFLHLVEICDHDVSLGVNADPSHCWEGEDFETRFTKVGTYVTGCHVKDHYVVPGRPLRSMTADWRKRGMQFAKLGDGQINLHRYVQLMIDVGYPFRYRKLQGLSDDATAPLVGEAESAYYKIDKVSTDATAYIDRDLCDDVAMQSFEKEMGN